MALGLNATTFMGIFLIVPSISPYLQLNLGFPRDDIPWLYMAGGAVSFFTMRLAGWAVDERGAISTATIGTILFAGALILGFAFEPALVPVPVFFVMFMVSGSFRMVPTNALTTRIPGPGERARYMSVMSTVQHLATTAGAVAASSVLGERADKGLSGMATVAWIAIGLGSILPFGVAVIEPWVRRIEHQRTAGRPTGATPASAAAAPAGAQPPDRPTLR
jgi:predicted MFS family arabinose efflux permease